MRPWATVYTNKKGVTMLRLAMPIDQAAAFAVGNTNAVSELRLVVSDTLNDPRGTGFGEAEDAGTE